MNKEEKSTYDYITTTSNNSGLVISKNNVDITNPDLYINGNKIENGYQLLKQCEKLNKALLDIKEYIKNMTDSRDIDQTYDIWYSCKEYLLDIVNKALGDNNE